MKKGILFSDIDGTLCFHEEVHGIKEISRNKDLVTARDTANGKDYLTRDISTDMYKVFIDLETLDLCRQIQERYNFILVTGARQSTMDARKEVMNFYDALILESGGLILDKDYQPDREWNALLEPEKKYLKDLENQLTSQGWVLDVKGRTTAIRVRKKDNPQRTNKFEELCQTLDLPEGLQKTFNLGHLDILLRSSGKDSATRYLMSKFGHAYEQSIGIGDDVNDIPMLREIKRRYVLKNALPEALETAKKEGWYISQSPHFSGAHEILKHILSL